MPHNADSTPPLSVLRIYVRRRGSPPGRGFGGWWLGRARSYDLAECALNVPEAKRVVFDVFQTPLPTCAELVGPVAVLAAFVDANRDELIDAVLLRFDGINVSLQGGLA